MAMAVGFCTADVKLNGPAQLYVTFGSLLPARRLVVGVAQVIVPELAAKRFAGNGFTKAVTVWVVEHEVVFVAVMV
jgi:hypothetical protein